MHGRNDEGIKSAKGPCGEVFERVETVETKRKCRVWRCEQPTASEGAELDHWAVEVRGRGGPPSGRAVVSPRS